MILSYEPVADDESPERVSVEAPGSHCVSCAYKDEILAALHDLRPRNGARLVLFDTDVAGLREAERQALLRRVGFVPASGGLMSSLNAWENIALPVGYHAPHKLRGAHEEVRALLERGVPASARPFGGLVYRQVMDHLRGVRDLRATRDLIVRENRRYARRQLIWFRKEPRLMWFDGPGELPEVQAAILRWLAERGLLIDGGLAAHA